MPGWSPAGGSMQGPLAHLILPLALASGAGTALAAPQHAPTGAELVELEVLGVVPLDAEPSSLLVLRQKGGPIVLPLCVGRNEGAAIALRLKRVTSRPRSADLLAKTIAALGGKVARVALEAEQATLFHARVTLQQGERRLEVEARPSDSIALAVAAQAPIFVSRQLLNDAGLAQEDLGRLQAPPKRPADDRARPGPAKTF